jgi:hypothetical protein
MLETTGPNKSERERQEAPQQPSQEVETNPAEVDSTPNYSVFTRNQKKAIIFAASWASFFSPLTANIYLPALNTISQEVGPP